MASDALAGQRLIGYLPESTPLYTDMTTASYLDFMARLRGLDRRASTRRVSEVVEQCGLQEYLDVLLGKLSKGFRQRVGLAQAIIHDPQVLILDEPTIGIDPIQVAQTRRLIKDLGRDRTILLSTHILPEVSMICQRVIIISEGHVAAMDTPENLSSRLGGPDHLRVTVRGPAREVAAMMRDLPGVQTVDWNNTAYENVFRYEVICRPGRDVRPQLAAGVVQRRWDLLELQAIGMSLEDIFLRLTTKEDMDAHA
jgi:ABC-2 type transport system ATP-binding protein